MIVVVNSPLKTDKVAEVLDGYEKDGVTYKLIKKEGMKLTFQVEGVDRMSAIDLTKKIIRSYDFGKVLYFQVVVE